MRPKFTCADFEEAHDQWGANCGPGAVACICGMTLGEVRLVMGDFEQKGYTNPTLMWQVLDRIGVQWRLRPERAWPQFGLARIQWHGPWMNDGVPVRARYRHTHWVGCDARRSGDIGIFDINALGNGSGWSRLEDWTGTLVPWLLEECEPRANGAWSITHSVEVGMVGRAAL